MPEPAVPAERLEQEIDLRPYADDYPLTVHACYPLAKVHTIFRSLGLRHLCVVNSDHTLHGIITRKELMSMFNHDLT